MAQKITVQDGKVLYVSSDPAAVSMDFSIRGVAKIGNDPAAAGLITTPAGSIIDLILSTSTAPGNLRLQPAGRIILNNLIWPPANVTPTVGMFLSVVSPNTLGFVSPSTLTELTALSPLSKSDLNLRLNSAIGSIAYCNDIGIACPVWFNGTSWLRLSDNSVI